MRFEAKVQKISMEYVGTDDERFVEIVYTNESATFTVKGYFSHDSEIPKIGESFNFTVSRSFPLPVVGKT